MSYYSSRKLTEEEKAEQSKRFDAIIDSFIDETTSSEEVKPKIPVKKPSLKKQKSLDDIFS